MAKLNGKQIAIGYTAATFTSVTAGAVLGYLANDFGFRVEYDQAVLGTWLIVTGLPAAAVASGKALRTLGQKPQTAIVATGATGPGGYNLVSNGRGGYSVFENVLNVIGSGSGSERQPARRPELPSVFTVENLTWSENQDPITLTFTEGQVRSFLEAAWSRQTSDNGSKRAYPLSRRYFMREWRPRLSYGEYEGIITLCSNAGLIVNRTAGRSGKLTLRPKLALNQVKFFYGLQPA